MLVILNMPLLIDTQITLQCQPEREHWLLVVEATSPVHLPPSHSSYTRYHTCSCHGVYNSFGRLN